MPQAGYLTNVHVCPRAISMHMFSLTWSIVSPCRCLLWSFIWVYCIVLFTVRKSFVREDFVVLGTEGKDLLYKIYHRADRLMHEYLHNFVAARNTSTLAALGELALVIPRCRTDQIGRSFLPAAVHPWNLLPSSVFSGGTLSAQYGSQQCGRARGCKI